ncbi:MAG: ATP-binding protein [Chloroflexota bacterium]|nr:ATP-binding protein [Chloroflexota bacterium]
MATLKALVSWSSGKDSAWALHTLRREGRVELAGLLTTFNRAAGRVAMHAVRERLVEAQARALGLPLVKVLIPSPCSNEEYEQAMGEAMARAKADGINAVAFGDLFLQDVRRYREEKLAGTGIEPLFPLWGLDTSTLARQMVEARLRAYVTCVDPKQLDPSFAGRAYDEQFLDDLPPGVDPCGERGEFHTFVHDGPMFQRPIPVVLGQVVHRDGFVFADVLPSQPRRAATRAPRARS